MSPLSPPTRFSPPDNFRHPSRYPPFTLRPNAPFCNFDFLYTKLSSLHPTPHLIAIQPMPTNTIDLGGPMGEGFIRYLPNRLGLLVGFPISLSATTLALAKSVLLVPDGTISCIYPYRNSLTLGHSYTFHGICPSPHFPLRPNNNRPDDTDPTDDDII